jgi:hypothetical protein
VAEVLQQVPPGHELRHDVEGRLPRTHAQQLQQQTATCHSSVVTTAYTAETANQPFSQKIKKIHDDFNTKTAVKTFVNIANGQKSREKYSLHVVPIN